MFRHAHQGHSPPVRRIIAARRAVRLCSRQLATLPSRSASPMRPRRLIPLFLRPFFPSLAFRRFAGQDKQPSGYNSHRAEKRFSMNSRKNRNGQRAASYPASAVLAAARRHCGAAARRHCGAAACRRCSVAPRASVAQRASAAARAAGCLANESA